MKRRFTLIALFLTTFTLGLLAQKPTTLRMVTGVKGGSYEAMGSDIMKFCKPIKKVKIDEHWEYIYDSQGQLSDSNLVRTKTESVTEIMEVKNSRGSYDNYQRLIKSDFHIGFLQYDIMRNEFKNEIDSRFKRSEKLKVLMPLGHEQVHIIVRKDAEINSVEDLREKVVSVGNSLQGTNYTASIIDEALKIGWKARTEGLEYAIKSFIRKKVDAIVFVGAAPVDIFKMFKNYEIDDEIKLLPLPENEALKDIYGERTTIPASAYSWLDEEVKTYSVRTLLVATGNFNNGELAMLDKVMQAIKTNISTMQQDEDCHPAWKNISMKKDPDIIWEYHEIAEKYLD